jgi:hypothetical protein
MNFEKVPVKSEFNFKSEDITSKKAAEKLLSMPDFKSLSDYFQEDNIQGEFNCSLNVLAGQTIIFKNETPITANSFGEVQEKISTWINSELEKMSTENGGSSFEIKKFLIDFSFTKDGEDAKTGWRRVLDSEWQ